jgi:hypothetical protein
MPRVRLFHWKAAESAPVIALLRSAGYTVEYSDQFAEFRAARKDPPAAFVIDLTRMPSAGREVAVALRGGKATRNVPIVFVDGEAEKVAATRRVIPDAAYTTRPKLASALKSAIAKPPKHPFVPTQMMDRFAGRSVVQKLGITPKMKVAVVDGPAGYQKALDGLPEGVALEDCASDGMLPAAGMYLWFLHDPGIFQDSLRSLRAVTGRSRVWVLWRKGKRDGLDGNVIRHAILEIGLVDYTICSFSDAWSAMAIARKKQKTD